MKPPLAGDCRASGMTLPTGGSSCGTASAPSSDDREAGVHHLYGVRRPRIGAAIVSPVGRRSRHRDYGRSNPIELTFATVRHRVKVTTGHGSKAAGIAMAFKLIEAAMERWRAVGAPHLVALDRAGPALNAASALNADPCSRPPKPPATPLFSGPPPRINPSATPRHDLHPQVLTIAHKVSGQAGETHIHVHTARIWPGGTPQNATERFMHG
jgi:hypothetical protein